MDALALSRKIIETPTKISYILSIEQFVKLPITNWVHNRPYDPARIPEISAQIFQKKPILDGVFYLNHNSTSGQFDIIDGIHRYQSIITILRENAKPVDLVFETNPFQGDIQWLLNMPIYVNIYQNLSKGNLFELFETINKSIPIPELYFRDENGEKRACIYGLVDCWSKKYKSHFSPNNKTNIPNINRDRFMDLLSSIYDKYGFTSSSQGEFIDLIERTNSYIGQNLPVNVKLTEKILKKCADSGCYLFIKKIDKILADISKIQKLRTFT